jgi:hypothetical protein
MGGISMIEIGLSTSALVQVLPKERNWDNQVAIVHTLNARTDVYNIMPLCEFMMDPRQNRNVQREVGRCIARHGAAQGVKYFEEKVGNLRTSLLQKKLALRALADFSLPEQTIPVLERIASTSESMALRAEALFRIGAAGRLENLPLLSILTRHRNPVVAEAAARALNKVVDTVGGHGAAVAKLLGWAEECMRQRNRDAAEGVVRAALRLSPDSGRVLLALARLQIAA